MTWPTKKLGEVCEVIAGQSPEGRFYNKSCNGSPFYQGKKEFTEKFIGSPTTWTTKITKVALKNDILMSVRAPVGPVNFATEKICIGRGLAAIRVTKKIDKDFLFHFLRSFETEIVGNLGAVFNSINKKQIEELEIPLPSIEEQKRIVEKIEKLFAKIDEAMRLRAESSAASAALLPSALHQVFSMQDSRSAIRANHRMTKTRWEEKTISEVTEINPSKKEISGIKADTAVSFVPMSAVSEKTQSIERRQERKLGEVKKGYTYFKENDVLFAKITPCMENGKIVIAKNLKYGIGFGSTEFHVVRAKEKILPAWLFYFLWNPEFREEAEKHMTGTAGQQRVPADFLGNSKIPLPPIAEQRKIVAYLDALSQKARELQNLQTQTAADFFALRQSILHRTFQHS